jgi:lysyl-tRNA synthetase class 2
VYAWNNSKDGDVGVEYVVMEKAPGEELAKCWSTMDIKAYG